MNIWGWSDEVAPGNIRKKPAMIHLCFTRTMMGLGMDRGRDRGRDRGMERPGMCLAPLISIGNR